MATDLAEQLKRLGHKAELLTTRYATLLQQNEELRQELRDMQATVLVRDGEIEKLRLELEYLKVSSAIAPDSETARKAQARISELVREIDACVADLMRDL